MTEPEILKLAEEIAPTAALERSGTRVQKYKRKYFRIQYCCPPSQINKSKKAGPHKTMIDRRKKNSSINIDGTLRFTPSKGLGGLT